MYEWHRTLWLRWNFNTSTLFHFVNCALVYFYGNFHYTDATIKRFFLIFDIIYSIYLYLYKVEIQKFLWSRRRLQDSQYVSQYYMKSCFKLRFQKLIRLGKNPKKDDSGKNHMIYAVLSPSTSSAKLATRTGHLLPPILHSPKYSMMSVLMAAWN